MRPFIEVPRTLDAAPRFLFWDIDYVLVAGVGLSVGLIVHGISVGLAVMVLFCWGWSLARSGRGVNRALAFFFWHLPFDVFERVPASARRHFMG